MSIKKHNIKAKSHILSLLGDELIGSDSLAIFELVKNAYDADATKVKVSFINLNQENQKIIIEDNGNGMFSNIIQDVWLTIGTDFKRGKNRKESPLFNRVSFGNKGVGRLAVHKLAKKITLETQARNDMFSSRLEIDWPKLIDSKEFIQDLEVDVETIGEALFEDGHGTRIILNNLATKIWTKKTLKDLVRKVNNIKNPFKQNPNFEIIIEANDYHDEWIKEVSDSIEILEDSLYQFNFEIYQDSNNPNGLVSVKFKYFFNPPKQTNLLKREEEIIINEIHIGTLFKDIDEEKEVFHFLRNKDLDGIGNFKGQFYVYNQNSNLLKMNFGGQINAIKQFIKDNCGIKIFRDNIRVYNYGEPFDDWLGLDLDKIQRAGDHFGKKVTVGAIELNLKDSNDGLIEKTNREGFIDNHIFEKFRFITKDLFYLFEKQAEEDKDLIEEFLEGTKPIKKVGFGDTIKELEIKLKSKDLDKELSPLLTRIDKDYTAMRDIMVNSGMTGLNLGVAFHEVDREVRVINQELNIEGNNVDLESIKDKIKNLVQILESLSPLLRQNKSNLTSAKKIVEIAIKRNINRFKYHNVVFSSPLLSNENPDITFKVPTNLLISSISNIIDNSLYWTKAKVDLSVINNENYKPAIYIGTDIDSFEGPAIIIADNGLGFSVEPEYMTQPFKTKKSGGMGLGLYFSDVVMNMVGGKLIFPDSLDLNIPKAYDGACIALVFPK
ncbi:ATP-binding protein [Flavobacterium geliluteum]|uniref:ATP-binding protein n=1 Tax=Flavobacterium geliluteum TaxID=2816120 RepID=A0A940X890_9FLAO|nr:ATP-binding protein [Flavobacterium geliluteum]MBP4138769.1 ATP-binding protein [Flavobacterium geliluteum]